VAQSDDLLKFQQKLRIDQCKAKLRLMYSNDKSSSKTTMKRRTQIYYSLS